MKTRTKYRLFKRNLLTIRLLGAIQYAVGSRWSASCMKPQFVAIQQSF